MRIRILYAIAAIGVVLGLASAYVSSERPRAQVPVFNPASNPYADGIYANGIVESYQNYGEDITIYPEVSGPITQVLVAEGQAVTKGTPLVTIDDAVQRATMEQQRSQAEAALAMLDELRAQPRKENLDVSNAQVENAKASLKNAQDQRAKQEASYRLDPKSVSQDALDNARNAERIAATNLEVVQRQYELTKAGAWVYDIRNQERQYDALSKAYAASDALLRKYTIRAPVDGVVLSLQAAVGSYASPQGAYDAYTQGMTPLIVMGTPQDFLAVRTYVDEILVHRLPAAAKMEAQMFVRGTDIKIPLTFVRVQPYVSPKIELSDQRQERVDVRVLPVIFRFEKPKDLNIYPGQLVDVYVGAKADGVAAGPTAGATR
ncbi:MAG TPA: biotin/lipoyl-binding protein [Candidatus Sulfotelmatobacter sp.]|nr:biotin/lipoyl-binding protein [Candidatus Sulfotelmatobacter sp.]